MEFQYAKAQKGIIMMHKLVGTFLNLFILLNHSNISYPLKFKLRSAFFSEDLSSVLLTFNIPNFYFSHYIIFRYCCMLSNYLHVNFIIFILTWEIISSPTTSIHIILEWGKWSSGKNDLFTPNLQYFEYVGMAIPYCSTYKYFQ